MKRHISVPLADDTLVARAGRRLILETDGEIEVVGEAIVIEAVLPQVRKFRPDVVLLDLKWDHDQRTGLEVIPRIKKEIPETKVIAVSAHDELVAQAKLRGADGALPKSFTRDQLLAAIRAVYSEHAVNDETLWPIPREIEAQQHMTRLAELRPGRRDAKGYEVLIEEILKFLFSEHLSDFEAQCRHHGGDEILDYRRLQQIKRYLLEHYPRATPYQPDSV